MRILIDGQTLLSPDITRGIGKYFLNSVENILQYDFTNDFFLTAPSGPHLNLVSPWARNKLQILTSDGYASHAVNGDGARRQELYSDTLNNDIEKHGIDLYWTPNALMDNVVLPSKKADSCRFAVTIFDLIVSVMETEYAKQRPASMLFAYKDKLRSLERDFDLFLHISHHTHSDFERTLDVGNKQHVVTPLAVDPAFQPPVFQSPELSDYIIYPGGFDPRKNMDRAVEAFALLNDRDGSDGVKLCIVCSADPASESMLFARAKELGVANKVQLTGFVEDAALVSLYQRARCLFFPSLYEGFGLPVLEGLACGLPVAISNTSSLPEVGGEHAIYFDPYDVEDMAAGLHRALAAPVDAASRRRRYEYSRTFTWKKTALTTIDAFLGRADNVQFAEAESVVNDEAEKQSDLIDVRQRMKDLSVEELRETAEEFFARLHTWDYLHSKPFAAINETPDLLIGFAHVLQGLDLLPGMTILDFGAGSCWTSRFLSQLGLSVIAVDVSPSALRIGEALYERLPLIGDQPAARFLEFDGHKLELPNEAVDRISCWDAFHHVSNPADVLKEMARVLKPGGIAGFSEPGPEHSKTPQSQYEMRTNRLIENDINVDEIFEAATAAGFTDIKVALFNPVPMLLQLDQFNASIDDAAPGENYLESTRREMQHRRLFFLFKGEPDTASDSRRRTGLLAELTVEAADERVLSGDSLALHVVVANRGAAVWLPGDQRIGGVRFGIHLFDETEKLLELDYFRQNLTVEPRNILPGETLEFDTKVPMPSPGKYILQCDLVSESVCWFEHNGSPTVRLRVEVS